MLAYFIIAMAAVFAFPKLRRIVLVRRTGSWPEVQGRVVSIDVIDHFAEGATAEIGYAYSVEEVAYGGFVRRNFIDAQPAWDFVNGCRDMNILVHYNPNRPEKSVVWRSLH
jgi:hypothetical protein